MEIQMIHGEDRDVVGVLDVTKERLDTIMLKAQTVMLKKHSRGTKARFLEMAINECETINEVVAATISWKEMTDHMQRVEMEKMSQAHQSKIIKPGGIIRPIN